jgi:peptide/nickel transport system permease protein
MRGSMLEVIHQDFIRTARAKGLSERTVVFKHALRNALIPIVTLLGLYLPYLLSGAVLVETIFAWPGMGRLIVEAIFQRDYPLVMATSFVAAGDGGARQPDRRRALRRGRPAHPVDDENS